MKVRSLVSLGSAAVLGFAAPAAHADDQLAQLTVNARIVLADGGPGSSSSSPHPMVVGQGVTSFLFASQNLCGVGGAKEGARGLDDLRRSQGHVWQVSRKGVRHGNGKMTFDLEWARYDGGSSAPAVSARQRLTLAEGSTYPLDIVRATAPTPCNAASVILEIAAGTIEAPEFADTVLQYDLWVTHQDNRGQKQTRHFVVSAKQGASSPFEFAPFRFDIPKFTADQYELDLVTRILGTVKGRLRQDGKVDVDLETRRIDKLERPDEPKTQRPSAGGRKSLEVRLGETVEIELPASNGYVAHAASPQSSGFSGGVGAGRSGSATPAPAVTLTNGMVFVNFREFFSDDRFAVLLRVRKE